MSDAHAVCAGYVMANVEEDRATVRRIATLKRCRLGQGDRLHAGRRAVFGNIGLMAALGEKNSIFRHNIAVTATHQIGGARHFEADPSQIGCNVADGFRLLLFDARSLRRCEDQACTRGSQVRIRIGFARQGDHGLRECIAHFVGIVLVRHECRRS
jgi:hypothetical protein